MKLLKENFLMENLMTVPIMGHLRLKLVSLIRVNLMIKHLKR